VKRKEVLVCDDDVLVQKMLKIILERDGFLVIQAFDGSASQLALQRQRFDAVIMDLHMPFVSGMELIGFMRQKLALKEPVIVLLALNDVHLREQAIEQGANHFLQKPVNPDVLIELLRQLTLGSSGISEND